MNTHNITLMLQLAGVLHLGIFCAGMLMPYAVGMRKQVAVLPPFLRRLFWVYYVFIAFCLVNFGALTFFGAQTLAEGGLLARVICIFLTIFWTMRLLVAAFVLDVRPYLTNAFWRMGYAATNIAFGCLPIVYAIAALNAGGK